MTVAGKAYEPTEEILEYENEGTQRLQSSGPQFLVGGGEYGFYKISYLLENEELSILTQDQGFKSYPIDPLLTFVYFNANWWQVTQINITANMRLVDGEWFIDTKVVYRESRERGKAVEQTVAKTLKYTDILAGKGIVEFGG